MVNQQHRAQWGHHPRAAGGVRSGAAWRTSTPLVRGRTQPLWIDLREGAQPWKQFAPPNQRSQPELDKKLHEMAERSFVEQCQRSACANVMKLREKERSSASAPPKYRLICDLWQFNKNTKYTKTCNPHSKQLFLRLSLPWFQWYCKIDLKDAYHQIDFPEEKRHLTAFLWQNRLYHWRRMPQGGTQFSHYFQFFATCICRLAEQWYYREVENRAPPPRDLDSERTLEVSELDDFIIMGKTPEACRKGTEYLFALLTAELKMEVDLGWWWDKQNRQVGAPCEKLQHALRRIGTLRDYPVIGLDDLKSILGTLQHYGPTLLKSEFSVEAVKLVAEQQASGPQQVALPPAASGELEVVRQKLMVLNTQGVELTTRWTQCDHWDMVRRVTQVNLVTGFSGHPY
eukprot:TRINITY_DN9727_c3_g1_i1.p1 TRINITY_DN9727_c3_g1~~TRINITY_DN9727_c3_g1_i1.p1  ORF type:complete len:400 (+),score=56.03 TRINITY_DN9727_c3_g1_i1:489-1688(+)